MTQTHKRLWGDRFSEAPDEATIRFMAGRDVTSTPPADMHLIAADLWATEAHVAMLAQQGIIPSADARLLLDGLAEIERRHSQGRFHLDPAREDVHTNIEMTLVELCGVEAGGRVHTGRSRNDQVATAMRIYLREQVLAFASQTIDLARTLLDIGAEHSRTIMPGFSHYQPATPTTLGHVLASYGEAFERDTVRFLTWLDLHNYSPLGSVAGYGTTIPLDRNLASSYLAFEGPHLTSLDPMTTRGEAETDLALALAALLKHLASLAQTVILLSGPGYGVLRLSSAYSSGSSVMPHKVNPDTMEVIKAKAAVANGAVAGLLSVGAATFMGYNRDTQWSKYLIIDLIEEAREAPAIMTGAWRSMGVDVIRAGTLAQEYFVGSTALMEWLTTRRQIPFRQAKRVVEIAVRLSEEDNATQVTAAALHMALHENGLSEDIDDAQIVSVQKPAAIIAAARTEGGPSLESVQQASAVLRERLDSSAVKLAMMNERLEMARQRLHEDGVTFAVPEVSDKPLQ